MQLTVGNKKKVRFRRVSKARIFDGHPLKVSVNAVTVMVMAYLLITAAVSLFFSYLHDGDYSLVLWTLLPGALLGYFLLVLERLSGLLKEYMFLQMGKLLTAFLLFFIHTIGYLTLSSVIVSYPLSLLMGKSWGMAGEYSLFSANFFILLGLLSWLRNIRTPPYRCV